MPDADKENWPFCQKNMSDENKESCWTPKWNLESIYLNNEMNINIHIDINMSIGITKPTPTPCRGRPQTGPGGMGWLGWDDINIHIGINMNIDIHNNMNMNIEYWLLDPPSAPKFQEITNGPMYPLQGSTK